MPKATPTQISAVRAGFVAVRVSESFVITAAGS